MRRIALFVVVVSAILLGASGFVSATLGRFLGPGGWHAWQWLPIALALAFIPTTLLGFRYSNAGLRALYAGAAFWLGLLNYAFFAAIACWGIEALVRWMGGTVGRLPLGIAFFGGALGVTLYGAIHAASLRTTRLTISLRDLPEAWRGRRVALVTDLHLGHLSGPRFLARVVARLRALEPDMVLIGGDLFDGTPLGLDRLMAPWHGFAAPRGVYFVTGNHERDAYRARYLDAVRGAGIRILENEKVMVEGLQLVGVHDTDAGEPEALRAILRAVALDPGQASVLLSHQPSNLAVAEEAGVSLQLSGHTHGGQYWPWTRVVARVHGRFAYGLQRLGGLQVYTSSGAGTWGPPLRVGTRSEVVLIRFEEAAASA